MHFENIQLPASVVAELYRHSLVLLEDVQPRNTRNLPEAAVTILEPIAAKIAMEGSSKIVEEPAVDTLQAILDKPEYVPSIKYLGEFQKHIAIVLTEHFHLHIADEDLEFLSKLLGACHLSMNDVAIINVVNNQVPTEIWQALPVKVMLMFDVDPVTIGLPFRGSHFEIQKWGEAIYMNCPELIQFRTGNDQQIKLLKTKLWVCLQKIFLGK